MKVFVDRDTINDDVVLVIEIYKTHNSTVKTDDEVVTVETSKTTIDIISPCDGTLSIDINVGDEIEVGDLLFQVLNDEEMESSENKKAEKNEEEKSLSAHIFSKEAEKKIKELGLKDLNFSKKFVSLDDVMDLAAEQEPSEETELIDKKKIENVPIEDAEISSNISYIRKKTSLRKRAEITTLASRGNLSTQSVISIEINAKTPRSSSTPYLFRNTISDLVIYEASKLLNSYKELNGFYISKRELGIYEDINFGVSFDSGRNLKVLSILCSDMKTLHEIQTNIVELLDLYESGETISENLLTSSTITISDLSNTNASYMQPLVSAGQSSIIGLVKKSDFLFEVFLGFDHKVIEGMYATKYLEELKENIESHFDTNDIKYNQSCGACGMSMEVIKEQDQLGMVMVMRQDGKIEPICQVCFNGW